MKRPRILWKNRKVNPLIEFFLFIVVIIFFPLLIVGLATRILEIKLNNNKERIKGEE